VASGIERRNLGRMLKSRLPPRIFMLLEEAGRLADRSRASVYLVGGSVRDLLLGRSDHGHLDLDLVIEGDGIAFARAFAHALHADVTAHPRFGTAVVTLPDGFSLDVATARTESYPHPAALPVVTRSSIHQDLHRRDVTINALAFRLNAERFGELLDLYGGHHDLTEGIIRVLHPLSFIEDPTRVFRAVRFEQRFGFKLDSKTLRLIKNAIKDKLFARLSAARLREELILLLSEKEPRKVIARLGTLNLLHVVHPALRVCGNSGKLAALLKSVEQALGWYKTASLKWGDQDGEVRSVQTWLVYFAALLDMIPEKAVRETLTRLQFSERQADVLRLARSQSDRLLQALSRQTSKPSAVQRVLSGLPDEVLLLLLAKARGKEVKQGITAYLSEYRYVRAHLTGTDLKAMGLKPGPLYKRLLDRLLAAKLNGEVKTEADERELARKLTRKKT
jgi:tRNA nucleotidyltransferase (CCA-adding enzyme)